MPDSCQCACRKALEGLLWPHVISADDLAVLVVMCAGGSQECTKKAMEMVNALRGAQAEAAAALAAPCECAGLQQAFEMMRATAKRRGVERDHLRAELAAANERIAQLEQSGDALRAAVERSYRRGGLIPLKVRKALEGMQ